MNKKSIAIPFACICISTMISITIGLLCNRKDNNACYEQLVNNSLDSNRLQETNACGVTVQDIQKYFKPPVFESWFTNNVFFLKGFEIGNIETKAIRDDEALPEIALKSISVSNSCTIVFDPVSKNHDGKYIEFTYRNIRYQVCCVSCCQFHSGSIFGRAVSKNAKKIEIWDYPESKNRYYRFWFTDRCSRNVYVKKWILYESNELEEFLTVYRDDEDNVVLKFVHQEKK